MSRRTRPPCVSSGRPISCSRTTSSSAAPSAPRPGCRFGSRRTAPSSSTRCAATRISPPGGGSRSPRRAPSTSARSTSARCWRRSSGGSSACTRCRPGSTSTGSCRSRGRRRCGRSSRRADATRRTAATSGSPTTATPARFEAFLAGDGPTVVYFGKLIPQKGVQLLLEALGRLDLGGLDARAVIVGFGPQRHELERLALEAMPPGRTLFTGPLEHRHLRHLLPLADVTVVPSIFPEAFGMVAAEAAAAGSPPLVARHSGLAEVAAGIAAEYPEDRRELASFERGDAADLEAKLGALLALAARGAAGAGPGRARGRRQAVELGVHRANGYCDRSASLRQNGRRAARLLARAAGERTRRVRRRHRLHPRSRGGVRVARSRDAGADEPLRGAPGRGARDAAPGRISSAS